MARQKGLVSLAGNFEFQYGAACDARSVVGLLSDLTSTAEWQSSDGSVYTFIGMVVVVTSDPTPENNGMYLLKDADYTNITNWEKLGSGGSSLVTIKDWTTGIAYLAKEPLVNTVDKKLYRVVANYTSGATIEADILAGDLELIGGGGGADTYTGVAERNIGGITDGMIFTNATMTQMWDQLIKQEKFPVLTAPSSAFTSTVTGLRETGDIVDIDFVTTFNRGSINPQYTALSQFRSGLPNEYRYVGSGLSNQFKTDLSDSQSVIGYSVIYGVQTWQSSVYYDAGVQPKSSYDNDFNTPLPAGNTVIINRIIQGVFPYFGTSVNIATRTKQVLAVNTASYFQVDMVAESGLDKQAAWFHNVYSVITGIQFYNTVSSAWEWITGNKAASLTTFTTNTEVIDINGSSITYRKYLHNGSLIGARQLRFYTT